MLSNSSPSKSRYSQEEVVFDIQEKDTYQELHFQIKQTFSIPSNNFYFDLEHDNKIIASIYDENSMKAVLAKYPQNELQLVVTSKDAAILEHLERFSKEETLPTSKNSKKGKNEASSQPLDENNMNDHYNDSVYSFKGTAQEKSHEKARKNNEISPPSTYCNNKASHNQSATRYNRNPPWPTAASKEKQRKQPQKSSFSVDTHSKPPSLSTKPSTKTPTDTFKTVLKHKAQEKYVKDREIKNEFHNGKMNEKKYISSKIVKTSEMTSSGQGKNPLKGKKIVSGTNSGALTGKREGVLKIGQRPKDVLPGFSLPQGSLLAQKFGSSRDCVNNNLSTRRSTSVTSSRSLNLHNEGSDKTDGNSYKYPRDSLNRSTTKRLEEHKEINASCRNNISSNARSMNTSVHSLSSSGHQMSYPIQYNHNHQPLSNYRNERSFVGTMNNRETSINETKALVDQRAKSSLVFQQQIRRGENVIGSLITKGNESLAIQRIEDSSNENSYEGDVINVLDILDDNIDSILDELINSTDDFLSWEDKKHLNALDSSHPTMRDSVSTTDTRISSILPLLSNSMESSFTSLLRESDIRFVPPLRHFLASTSAADTSSSSVPFIPVVAPENPFSSSTLKSESSRLIAHLPLMKKSLSLSEMKEKEDKPSCKGRGASDNDHTTMEKILLKDSTVPCITDIMSKGKSDESIERKRDLDQGRIEEEVKKAVSKTAPEDEFIISQREWKSEDNILSEDHWKELRRIYSSPIKQQKQLNRVPVKLQIIGHTTHIDSASSRALSARPNTTSNQIPLPSHSSQGPMAWRGGLKQNSLTSDDIRGSKRAVTNRKALNLVNESKALSSNKKIEFNEQHSFEKNIPGVKHHPSSSPHVNGLAINKSRGTEQRADIPIRSLTKMKLNQVRDKTRDIKCRNPLGHRIERNVRVITQNESKENKRIATRNVIERPWRYTSINSKNKAVSVVDSAMENVNDKDIHSERARTYRSLILESPRSRGSITPCNNSPRKLIESLMDDDTVIKEVLPISLSDKLLGNLSIEKSQLTNSFLNIPILRSDTSITIPLTN